MKLRQRPEINSPILAFSILERIDVGETPDRYRSYWKFVELSVSSNGSTWVKLGIQHRETRIRQFLSVSSNGSTWVKPGSFSFVFSVLLPFSILERIDVGETTWALAVLMRSWGLSVSSNGSTWVKHYLRARAQIHRGGPFSILERIDVGETIDTARRLHFQL